MKTLQIKLNFIVYFCIRVCPFMLFNGAQGLKDESGVCMIGDEIQDNTVMNGVSYFFSLFFTLS